MKTIEITVFEYEDLKENQDLLDKVVANWDSSAEDQHTGEDIWDSLKAFKDSLPDGPGDNWHLDKMEVTGLRLRTWIINNYLDGLEEPKFFWDQRKGIIGYSKFQKELNCPFTGTWADHSILEPMLDFVKDPTRYDQEWGDIIGWCEQAADEAWQKQNEYHNSEEYILESIEANGYTFDEEGNMI